MPLTQLSKRENGCLHDLLCNNCQPCSLYILDLSNTLLNLPDRPLFEVTVVILVGLLTVP